MEKFGDNIATDPKLLAKSTVSLAERSRRFRDKNERNISGKT